MRAILFYALISTAALGADSGVPPRANSGDYPVQGSAKTAVIAAAIVPPNQVSKMFSSGISKQYIVVEIAIYPEQGDAFDVESSDFTLKVGRRIGYAERPMDVAPWKENQGPLERRTGVIAEAGVIYEQSNDPVYGRRQSVGTYTGVAVTNGGPGQDPGPPPSGPDPRIVNDKVQHKALPEGEARATMAGYLYFPQYAKRSKMDPVELKYSKDDASVSLVFPK
jgi:hypothetical protein